MDTLAIVSMLAICWLMLLVLFMQARKLSNLTAKAIDLSSPSLVVSSGCRHFWSSRSGPHVRRALAIA